MISCSYPTSDTCRSTHVIRRRRVWVAFPIVNFPFISSNILASPTYGDYISQLICYSRACAKYSHFPEGAQVVTQMVLKYAALLLVWSHPYTNYMVVITNRFPLRNPYLKWRWIFSLSHIIFFFPLSPIILYQLHGMRLIRSRNC